tara:strand:- start:483 stop:860 length:378 start_codon:yes stop_codon:yes gene_type:complete
MAVKELKHVGKTFIQEKSIQDSVKELIQPKKEDKNKHYYYEDKSGNIDSNDLMKMIMNKLDKIGSYGTDNVYNENEKNMKAIEVDFQRDIFLNKIDDSELTSKEVKGKVNNKLDKLKALRKRNGS